MISLIHSKKLPIYVTFISINTCMYKIDFLIERQLVQTSAIVALRNLKIGVDGQVFSALFLSFY